MPGRLRSLAAQANAPSLSPQVRTETMATLINDKTGQRLETKHTNAEACALFAQHLGDKNHWLWIHLHKAVQDATRINGTGQHDKSIDFIADSFLLAIGYGLKRPMIRVHYKDQRFKLYLSQKGTICLKSGMLATLPTTPGMPPVYTHDPIGDEFYVGCLLRGAFLPASAGGWRDTEVRQQQQYNNRQDRPLTATESEFLAKLRENPVEFLAQCSKDMNRCCYCNLPLEDPRSKGCGYGSTCAKRWGLPWGDSKDRMENAPSFAKAYNEQGHGLCGTVRDKPQDESAWMVLGDWLEENGLPRCKMPKSGVVLPRNDSNGKSSTTSTPAPKIEQRKIDPFMAPPIPKTPELTQRTINSQDLRWASQTLTFSIERSKLGWKAGEQPDRVNVVSQKTGVFKTFTDPKSISNDEKSLGIEYKCETMTLRIWND